MFNKKNVCLLLLIFSLLSISSFANIYATDDIINIPKVKYQLVEFNSLNDIKKFKNTHDLYTFSNINVDLRKLSAVERKEAFIGILLPAIKVANAKVTRTRQIVAKLADKRFLNEEEKNYAKAIFAKYRVQYGDWKELESRLIVYPTSLILTQGAIESAWGTSRFFREGNNLFGMWSSNPNEPSIKAKSTRANGFVAHLKKYKSVEGSVSDLILTLSRGSAYKNLRTLVNKKASPAKIATGLIKYSEEGPVYVNKIINTMKHNEFEKYDN